jgi:hypothetical protein
MKSQEKKPLGYGNSSTAQRVSRLAEGPANTIAIAPALSFSGLSGTSVTPPCHQDPRSGLSESLDRAFN